MLGVVLSGDLPKESLLGRCICPSEDAELGTIAKNKKPFLGIQNHISKKMWLKNSKPHYWRSLSLSIQSTLSFHLKFDTFCSEEGTGGRVTEKHQNATALTLRTDPVT